MAQQGKREKIAILGGGMSALSAAFELSRLGWQERFESITVYQIGWRLGGKGASGRGENERIEEHGLHLWLGFYENAFRIIQDCYAELNRPADAPFARWDQAFTKAPFVGLTDQDHQDQWQVWTADFPVNDRIPGRRHPDDPHCTVWYYLKQTIKLMIEFIDSLDEPEEEEEAPHGFFSKVRQAAQERIEDFARGAKAVVLIGAFNLIQELEEEVDEKEREGKRTRALKIVDKVVTGLKGKVGDRIQQDDRTRRLLDLIELSQAVIRGTLTEDLPKHGLSAIDDIDSRDWLRKHGAPEEVLQSAILRGLYDLAFAYRDGESSNPQFAAGHALRCTFRLFFTYKGAIFWSMRAGMGDIVFAPLYEVLKKRGVQFRFFHRVKELHLSADQRSISSIDIARQVDLVDEAQGYQPLIDVKGLPCWPSQPLYDQIQNADQVRGHDLESFWSQRPDAGEVTLRVGEDFDRIVLGISLGALPFICDELVQHNANWKAMVENVATVQTRAFQVWLSEDIEALGWPHEQVNLSAYADPFDTWADMRHLIPWENVPTGQELKAIAYFCNVMPTAHSAPNPNDYDFPQREANKAKASAITHLRQNVSLLWPHAIRNGDFRWELLAGEGNAVGVDRFDSQYVRANTNPSDRYVLSLPGTMQYRMKTDQTGYTNLYVVGDWIDSGFNAGCIEACAMAGMEASHAIWGRPALSEIVGLDFA